MRAMGILERLLLNALHWQRRLFAILRIQRFHSTVRADVVHVTLGKHSAQPGLQRTAPVKITEKRAIAALPVHQTEKIGEQGVRKLLRVRAIAAGLGDCSGTGPQAAAIFLDKIFPPTLRPSYPTRRQ